MGVRRLTQMVVAVALAMVPGCDEFGEVDGGVDDEGEVSERGVQENGFRLNGFRLNGFRLNGFRLNGYSLLGAKGSSDYIKMEGMKLGGGVEVDESWLSGGNLHARTSGGDILSGTQLAGAEMVFDVVDGVSGKKTRVVKIASVTKMAPDSDVYLYDFTMQENGGGWASLCLDDDNVAHKAVLLADVWDPATGDRISPRPTDAITIACGGAALSKCVEWGYAPWKTVNGTSLASHHQACTRAVRADYCGDGTPHTVDGLEVHFKDGLGIQKVDALIPYLVEAEWSAAGALCVNPDNTRLPDVTLSCSLPTCTSSIAKQSLIQTGTLQ